LPGEKNVVLTRLRKIATSLWKVVIISNDRIFFQSGENNAARQFPTVAVLLLSHSTIYNQ
jgi:hypothetical protein